MSLPGVSALFKAQGSRLQWPQLAHLSRQPNCGHVLTRWKNVWDKTGDIPDSVE